MYDAFEILARPERAALSLQRLHQDFIGIEELGQCVLFWTIG